MQARIGHSHVCQFNHIMSDSIHSPHNCIITLRDPFPCRYLSVNYSAWFASVQHKFTLTPVGQLRDLNRMKVTLAMHKLCTDRTNVNRIQPSTAINRAVCRITVVAANYLFIYRSIVVRRCPSNKQIDAQKPVMLKLNATNQ